MNFEPLKDFLNNPGARQVTTGVAVLLGIVLLFLLFKTGKFLVKIIFFLVAVALLAGALWWHFR